MDFLKNCVCLPSDYPLPVLLSFYQFYPWKVEKKLAIIFILFYTYHIKYLTVTISTVLRIKIPISSSLNLCERRSKLVILMNIALLLSDLYRLKKPTFSERQRIFLYIPFIGKRSVEVVKKPKKWKNNLTSFFRG